LWAAVVAERLGFRRDESLTFGRAVAGLNAYSKGVSLGLQIILIFPNRNTGNGYIHGLRHKPNLKRFFFPLAVSARY
jgi:hypothetical protein